MSKKLKDSVWEAAKEAGRVALLAVISWGIAKLAILPESETVLIGTILLRALDKWLHELGGSTKNDLLVGGLVRF